MKFSIKNILLFIFLLFIVSFTCYVKADEYNKLSVKINKCLAIPANKVNRDTLSYIFLRLNPISLLAASPINKTYYERSLCFFDLAREEKQLNLCAYVKEHKALFLDGSEVSERTCQKYVKDQINTDKKYAALFYDKQQLTNAYFALNGNGKDFNFYIKIAGNKSCPYKVKLELFDNQENLGTLYSNVGAFGGDYNNYYSIFITRQNLFNILKNRPINKIYRAKITLTLNFDHFIMRHISDSDKIITKDVNVNFSTLSYWNPY